LYEDDVLSLIFSSKKKDFEYDEEYLAQLSLFMLVIGCSPRFQIQTDTPFPGDFDNYQSFKFFNPANMPASNFSFDEEAKKVIYDAVATEMKATGVSKHPGG
jgi:hypothetical protein